MVKEINVDKLQSIAESLSSETAPMVKEAQDRAKIVIEHLDPEHITSLGDLLGKLEADLEMIKLKMENQKPYASLLGKQED